MLGPGNTSLRPEDSPVRYWSPLQMGELSPACVIEPGSARAVREPAGVVVGPRIRGEGVCQ